MGIHLFIFSINPEDTVTEDPGAVYKLLTVTFEFIRTTPELIITSEFSTGIVPQLQFCGFSQSEEMFPVHLFEILIAYVLLTIPSVRQRYTYP